MSPPVCGFIDEESRFSSILRPICRSGTTAERSSTRAASISRPADTPGNHARPHRNRARHVSNPAPAPSSVHPLSRTNAHRPHNRDAPLLDLLWRAKVMQNHSSCLRTNPKPLRRRRKGMPRRPIKARRSPTQGRRKKTHDRCFPTCLPRRSKPMKRNKRRVRNHSAWHTNERSTG